MIPVWQMMLGVCVGLVALIFVRPQALSYDREGGSASGGRSRRRKSTSDQSAYTPRFNSSPGDACVICLLDMQNDNMTYLRCGHAMHDKCFTECKRHTKNCPVCRERM
ncbi:uncharacterized protein LOC105214049 [Zeugodacus cucurbitae]|uniref:uncharacterized protein LOC105214049 n=1 Tax=Zeugodacus cucurbitae TaxID=28588 RepID=UPI0005969B0F|nr:uncharacterized protein LOC105214049 [Zeugodacus cucurbitae]